MRAARAKWMVGPDGRVYASNVAQIASRMRRPVQCNCGRIYDTCSVKVTARYADCDLWHCPNCGVVSDNRPWVHQPYRTLGWER